MSKKDQYYFGSLIKEVAFYAFPRTGAHFLTYCLSGLFDLVTDLPEEHRTLSEAISRQDELQDLSLYALELREAGVPFQPLRLDALKNGVHGTPIEGPEPVLVLSRHPLASAYSAWRSRDRLSFKVEEPEEMNEHFKWYERFYEAALRVRNIMGAKALLVRFEDLVASARPLEQIVDFVELKPKLSPKFVHSVTRFDNFVKAGTRTFYRGGDNEAWKEDLRFLDLIGGWRRRDFSQFGYS